MKLTDSPTDEDGDVHHIILIMLGELFRADKKYFFDDFTVFMYFKLFFKFIIYLFKIWEIEKSVWHFLLCLSSGVSEMWFGLPNHDFWSTWDHQLLISNDLDVSLSIIGIKNQKAIKASLSGHQGRGRWVAKPSQKRWGRRNLRCIDLVFLSINILKYEFHIRSL